LTVVTHDLRSGLEALTERDGQNLGKNCLFDGFGLSMVGDDCTRTRRLVAQGNIRVQQGMNYEEEVAISIHDQSGSSTLPFAGKSISESIIESGHIPDIFCNGSVEV
jgi:hypothetical protein